MKQQLQNLSYEMFNKDISALSDEQIYDLLTEFSNSILTDMNSAKKDSRKMYYVSAEFLTGKLLKNNLANLGIREDIDKLLAENGKELNKIEDLEPEPSLGNGGLGRLASCYLDSVANLGLNAEGIGICYHFGLFKQVFEDNKQKEVPDPWLGKTHSLIRTDVSYKVQFADKSVNAVMYDLPISGGKSAKTTLHLFDIKTADESIVKSGIEFDKEDIEKNLTLFLYPDDSDENGKKLRIYQQYFMVSCAANYILDEMKKNAHSIDELSSYVKIQINDTHPAMIIPELIRLLTDDGIAFEKAVSQVTKACAYTNHTILAEALEKLDYSMLQSVVPQLMPIIDRLSEIIVSKYSDKNLHIVKTDMIKYKQVTGKNEVEYIAKNIKRVHMANMAVHFSSNVNGVAKLHTDILKNQTLKEFYEIYPEKFSNKTNGISFKRFLYNCNEPLTQLITTLIGEEFKKDSSKLQDLMKYKDDENTLQKLMEVKHQEKLRLKDYIKEKEKIELDENSIFDVQIKRLHEYKRQQMNALYVIDTYLNIKRGIYPANPITVIFGAKAAPSYVMAKNIIHLILCLQELINSDKEVSKYLKVVMLTNYNVSYAEKIIPASEISEQISLASKEASGTGNMKMMLNGAVTLGTLDGANVEIAELVGDENIYIFGKSSDEVIKLYETGKYRSSQIYEENPEIKKAVDFIISDDMLKLGDEKMLTDLHNDLITKDYFMALLDLEDYIKTKNKLIEKYSDKNAFAKMSLINIANAGYFSADRSVMEYNKDIWKL